MRRTVRCVLPPNHKGRCSKLEVLLGSWGQDQDSLVEGTMRLVLWNSNIWFYGQCPAMLQSLHQVMISLSQEIFRQGA